MMTDQERLKALYELVTDAIDSIESWAGYAASYYGQKYRPTDELAALRRRLAALESTVSAPAPASPPGSTIGSQTCGYTPERGSGA